MMKTKIPTWNSLNPIISLLVLLLFSGGGASAATITFLNKCDYPVWPGVLSNAGSPPLQTTGFSLPSSSSRSFQAPTGWSGRFWGRTGCNFSTTGSTIPGSCSTGDCGSGQVSCNGAGAQPPATLAEFTLGTGGLDFYDVSLVDGYNLPVLVVPSGGTGVCGSTGCAADLNRVCPAELRVGAGEACRSACEAFGRPEYCCSGAYGTPATCKPSVYSVMFKTACPRSYSYAYDDPTSTFTCKGADYIITFCPSATSSQKSTAPATPVTSTTPTSPVTSTPTPPTTPSITITPPTSTPTTTTPGYSTGPGLGTGSVSMSYDAPALGGTPTLDVPDGTGTGSRTMSRPGSNPETTTTNAGVSDDGSWLARMAMGESSATMIPSALHSSLIGAAAVAMVLIFCSTGL